MWDIILMVYCHLWDMKLMFVAHGIEFEGHEIPCIHPR
jgi:hypothetical protein